MRIPASRFSLPDGSARCRSSSPPSARQNEDAAHSDDSAASPFSSSITRRIAVARPVATSTSTIAPPRRTSPVATSNALGLGYAWALRDPLSLPPIPPFGDDQARLDLGARPKFLVTNKKLGGAARTLRAPTTLTKEGGGR